MRPKNRKPKQVTVYGWVGLRNGAVYVDMAPGTINRLRAFIQPGDYPDKYLRFTATMAFTNDNGGRGSKKKHTKRVTAP